MTRVLRSSALQAGRGARRDRGRRDRGSTVPLIILFFTLAGLMLTGGVVASAAFLQLRSLQSACDGAAVAAANGFDRGDKNLSGDLPFNDEAADSAVLAYAQNAWGADAPGVGIDVSVSGNRVVVQCTKVAHVPFEGVFAPNGISQTVTASSEAPLLG